MILFRDTNIYKRKKVICTKFRITIYLKIGNYSHIEYNRVSLQPNNEC